MSSLDPTKIDSFRLLANKKKRPKKKEENMNSIISIWGHNTLSVSNSKIYVELTIAHVRISPPDRKATSPNIPPTDSCVSFSLNALSPNHIKYS
uniref:Uncharacterized protein n=1 Tax=Glossina brevipalpis TaxID=37001 RepID=A0A1A9WDC9_9MUSC